VKKLNLSLKIILSFGSVLLAALVILALVIVATDKELQTERALWPGMWSLGYIAGALGANYDHDAATELIGEVLSGNKELEIQGYLTQVSGSVTDLAQKRDQFDQASGALEFRRIDLRRSVMDLALARWPQVNKAELSALLSRTLAVGDKKQPDPAELKELAAALEDYGAKTKAALFGAAGGAQGEALTGDQGAQKSEEQDFANRISDLVTLVNDLAQSASVCNGALLALTTASVALIRPPTIDNRRDFSHFGRIVIGILVLITLSTLLVWLLKRTVISPLSLIQSWLDESSLDVTKTALSLSRSSKSLAKGASENTKAVLNAISSLEVLLNTAKRNAGHAGQAKELIDRAKSHVDEAHASMLQISSAMEEIKNSGLASSQIVKTVDEIAFKTNILALNAAVEAARAGEAGLSFAVVADEVRNLANSSSAAAKSTTSILDSSLKRIIEGADLVKKAEESFDSLVTVSDEVADLMTGITEDSQSQAREIQDVHQSIALVDKVTQENSLEAAEAGHISNELNRQADLLNQTINHVAIVVTGQEKPAVGFQQVGQRSSSVWTAKASELPEAKTPPASRDPGHPQTASRKGGTVPKKSFGKPSQKELEKALPMDDNFF
jgi:methyl-accepting chemotaxis protein